MQAGTVNVDGINYHLSRSEQSIPLMDGDDLVSVDRQVYCRLFVEDARCPDGWRKISTWIEKGRLRTLDLKNEVVCRLSSLS